MKTPKPLTSKAGHVKRLEKLLSYYEKEIKQQHHKHYDLWQEKMEVINAVKLIQDRIFNHENSVDVELDKCLSDILIITIDTLDKHK